MRLLFVSHSLPPHGRPLDNIGGMQRVAIDLHDSLLPHRDAEVRALVLRSPWNQRYWRTPFFMAAAIREIRRLAERAEIDAILFSSMVTAALAVPLRRHLKRRGVAMAAIANGLDATTSTWPYPWFVRKVFDSLDLVLPISHATAQACQARGLSPDKCDVVLLGIRLDRFQPPAERFAAKEKLAGMGQFPGTPRILLVSVGRLVPRKGVAWFVRTVMPILPDDVCLAVVGDGPDRAKIEEEIASASLGGRVKLLGAVTESALEAVYQGGDLFVMPNVPVPNDMEGFGLVMLEAGLCGMPVIASKLEGIADVVTEGENGHLVPPGNAAAFCEAVLAYHADAELLAAASDRARKHTAARFGWAAVTDRYLAAIQSQLAESREHK